MIATRRPRVRAAVTAAVFVTGAFLMPACGGGKKTARKPAGTTETTVAPKQPPTLDPARVEAALKPVFSVIRLPAVPTTIYPKGGGAPQPSQVGGGRIKVRSVTCPRGIPKAAGETFDCAIAAGATSATVHLTEINAAGTKLRYKASFKSKAGGIPVTTNLNGRVTVK